MAGSIRRRHWRDSIGLCNAVCGLFKQWSYDIRRSLECHERGFELHAAGHCFSAAYKRECQQAGRPILCPAGHAPSDCRAMRKTMRKTRANQSQKAIGMLQRGFSLLELMISMALLSIVVGVVVQALSVLQQKNAGELNRVDLT